MGGAEIISRVTVRVHEVNREVVLTFWPRKERTEVVLCYEERSYDIYKELLGFIDRDRSTRVSERVIGKSKYW